MQSRDIGEAPVISVFADSALDCTDCPRRCKPLAFAAISLGLVLLRLAPWSFAAAGLTVRLGAAAIVAACRTAHLVDEVLPLCCSSQPPVRRFQGIEQGMTNGIVSAGDLRARERFVSHHSRRRRVSMAAASPTPWPRRRPHTDHDSVLSDLGVSWAGAALAGPAVALSVAHAVHGRYSACSWTFDDALRVWCRVTRMRAAAYRACN